MMESHWAEIETCFSWKQIFKSLLLTKNTQFLCCACWLVELAGTEHLQRLLCKNYPYTAITSEIELMPFEIRAGESVRDEVKEWEYDSTRGKLKSKERREEQYGEGRTVMGLGVILQEWIIHAWVASMWIMWRIISTNILNDLSPLRRDALQLPAPTAPSRIHG